jgi:hypothetical protein
MRRVRSAAGGVDVGIAYGNGNGGGGGGGGSTRKPEKGFTVRSAANNCCTHAYACLHTILTYCFLPLTLFISGEHASAAGGGGVVGTAAVLVGS